MQTPKNNATERHSNLPSAGYDHSMISMHPLLTVGIFATWILCSGVYAEPLPKELPVGFVHLDEEDPTILVDLKYATDNNFVGERIEGYQATRAVMTEATAKALKQVQADLHELGYGLKVFDAYRPQRAVNHFVRWGRDLKAKGTKSEYYPEVPKEELFRRGYIATKSGHSRGSTIDVTLVKLDSPQKSQEVDMGTPFDFFDQQSWPFSRTVTDQQRENRLLLRTHMKNNGFRPYDREWWHFTLTNEPFPSTYFDFPIK